MNTSSIVPIIKKELKIYFNSPLAYIFIIAFITISDWLFFRGFFLGGQASMRNYFVLLPYIFLFLIPAITMRLWAEEKKMGTIETLLTYPVRDLTVIIGKFLASFIVLLMALVLTLPLPISLMMLGNPDVGVIVASYLGTLFLGSAYLAIGLWVSSFTENQIVSFIISIVITFLLFIAGTELVIYTLPDFLVPIFRYIGLGTHFDSIIRGVIDSRDVIYYILVITLFLYLNKRTIESRKWK